ncbi:TIGR01457 family HAD-type hydrolase [Brevibacillus sp. B_LB10_24]|uniref:TIGR01457 family HAD-type hydrolase n=1 Tax=Brevibacillus sp. B_LB10_24 TaxID=3380645 RepID=UPI0038BA7566
MKQYQGYLLDLDGTIYRGKEVIPEAIPFISQLREEGTPFLYLTNNSSALPETVAERLTSMGLPTEKEQVYTSSMATAAYLRERADRGTRMHVIGETGLRHALEESGFVLAEDNPAYVVVGIDREFTYEKLSAAARAILGGAVFVATNCDPALPMETGLQPGNGSLVAAISVASGAKPIVVGKPEKLIVDYALAKLGTPREQTIIVGDNLLTDIAAGVNSDIDSLLVLTGYSTAEQAAEAAAKPTYIAENVWAWREQLRTGV